MWLGLASRSTRRVHAAGKVRRMRLFHTATACVCLACSVAPYEVKGTALDPSAPSSLASPSSVLVPTPGTQVGPDAATPEKPGTRGTFTPDGGLP
jgi:hypothetical protein